MAISLIGTVGFKDTGVFINDFVASGEDGSEVAFKTEEFVNILRENERYYFVEKDYKKYQIPKDIVLRTEKNLTTYTVKVQDTKLLDNPNGRVIKHLDVGEQVELVSLQDEYGLFSVEDDVQGYILLKNLEGLKEEETLTIGISKVDKTLSGKNNTYYVLAKGEPVLIKDFKNGKFTIINEDGEEFQAAKDYIDLKRSRNTVSRSGLSRRTLTINSVVENAHKALGKPYVRGGIGPKSYDCSGLTYSLYKNHAGKTLNRSSKDQIKDGFEIKKSELIPGDLVFFRTKINSIGHVGLYIGDGNMIHASSGSAKVRITSIDEKWYKQRYVTARRIIK